MITVTAPAQRPLNPVEQKRLDAAVDAVGARLSDVLHPAHEEMRNTAATARRVMAEVYSDPGYIALKAAADSAQTPQEKYRLEKELREKYLSRVESAQEASHHAFTKADDAESDCFVQSTEAAFIAGELLGLREGIRLMSLLQAGRLEDVTGITEAEAKIRGALVDDGLAADLMALLLADGE